MNTAENYTIEIITIIGYLALMIMIGIIFKRFNSNVGDYFRNGCKGTWWLVGSSIFMASFSAWTFTGAAGLAYEAGMTMAVIYLANTIFLFLNFLIFGAWFRQLRAITTPEVIELRYDEKTRQFYAWVNVVTQLVYSALFLYGIAIFSSAVFSINIYATIIVLGLLVLFYTTLAGSWGVMAADYLQSLILMPMTALIAGLCIWKLGGFGSMMAQISEQGLSYDYALVKDQSKVVAAVSMYTVWWSVAMLVKAGAVNISINSANRFFAVKDGWEARKAALFACILMLLGTLLWIIPPITGRLLFAEQIEAVQISKPAESAFAIVSMNLLPRGLTGLMVIAIFMATVSSMDTGINRNAAIIVRDIYPALCRLFGWRAFSSNATLSMSRYVNLILGITVIALAYYFANVDGKGVLEFMLNISALLALPMSLPLLLGLFIKRAPVWSALVSVVAGFSVGGYGFITNAGWSFQANIFINAITGTVAFLLTMPFWKKSPESYHRKVDSFFVRMKTPVNFAEEVGLDNDLSQLKVIGAFALTVGLLLNLMLFIPNTIPSRLMIMGIAGFVAGIGGLMIIVGKRGPNRRARATALASAAAEQSKASGKVN